MLVYLGTGQRRYDQQMIRENRRQRWEFQAVVRGQIAPVINGTTHPARRRHLWLHPPNSLHGWTSPSTEAAEVIVFHFDTIPTSLHAWFRNHHSLQQQLSHQQIKELRLLAGTAAEHGQQPNQLTAFYHDLIAHRLCALLLAGTNQQPLQDEEALARYRVEAARAWYEANMPEAPNLEQVAAAIYMSPAHLRRMFKIATGRPMRDDLRRLQLAHVEDLLQSTDWPLYRIAEACGFRNQEVFSRTFKHTHGITASQWRKKRTRFTHR